MDAVSLCPLRVSSLFWQPRGGVHAMTVICRATYDLVAGQARLAAVQDYPSEEDNHWNDDPARSLYAASDFVPFSRVATCTCRRRIRSWRAARPLGRARLVVGSLDKSIEVSAIGTGRRG